MAYLNTKLSYLQFSRPVILHRPTWPKDLAGAWLFYTILPSPPWPKPKFNHVASFAPIVGLLLGLIEATILAILTYVNWPISAIALIAISLNIILTGGLHLDGLIDTADGVAAGKERCLEAMSDSRVGALGIQAFFVVLGLQVASLIRINSWIPVALPITHFLGRLSPLWAIDRYPYISQKGNSKFHKLNWRGKKEILPSLVTMAVILSSLIILKIRAHYLLVFISTTLVGILSSFFVAKILGNKLGGHTGDSYGACIVIVETIVLIFLGFLYKV